MTFVVTCFLSIYALSALATGLVVVRDVMQEVKAGCGLRVGTAIMALFAIFFPGINTIVAVLSFGDGAGQWIVSTWRRFLAFEIIPPRRQP